MGALPTLRRGGKPKENRGANALDVVLGIDRIWAVEPLFAAAARRALAQMDMAAHAQEFLASFDDDDDDEADPDYAVDDDGIACIHIAGSMTKRPVSWGRNTSTVLTRRAVRAAAADERAKAIALIVDSPGGQVAGTGDLAQDVAAAADQKPVGAYIEDLGASAAYWVASQCDFVHCNATAQVGSIGTLIILDDTSKMNDMLGIRTVVIGTGQMKGAGADGAPITDDQEADFRRMGDRINDEFVGAVSASRGIDPEKVLALEARVFIGEEAKGLGLVDAVGSIDEFFEELKGRIGREADGLSPAAGSAAEDLTGRQDVGMDGGGLGSPRKENEQMGEVKEETQPAAGSELGVAKKDILAHLAANGVSTAEQLKTVFEQAARGREYETMVREDAKTEAIRALGAEAGTAQAAYCEHMPFEHVIAIRDAWKAQADAKFGVGTNGQKAEGERLAAAREKANPGAVRRSGSSVPQFPANAEGDGQGAASECGSTWDKLTAEQQKHLDGMGLKGEARESAAKVYLEAASKGE